jgi:hypothetical protein
MRPLAVVEDLDVLPDGGFSLGSGRVAAMMNQFILEASPESYPQILRKNQKNGDKKDGVCQSYRMRRYA